MSNKVDSFQEGTDSEFETFIGLAEGFKLLKGADPKTYGRIVKNLQLMVGENFPNPPLSAEAAETILDQLDEPHRAARDEIVDILRVTSGEAEQSEPFMGDPEMFVTIDEAVSRKEIPRDIL